MQTLTRALFLLLAASLLAACGTNPVTGKTELQFISTTSEIKMGEQAYFPTRQMQGGDYKVHPELTRYVQGVNARLAAVSDRDLPFEIEVLNSSVPNAWAMPGGKMAINRGLLTALQSEAELAAVLGHEIVHAAARHGAKSQERGMLLQGAMIATQIAAAGNEYGSLISGGAMLGAQLTTTKYGRDAELESDLYGMEYMFKAGYNPAAAIDLQETFVRLSAGRQSNWVDGLFASHPPSADRVAKNRETAARLGGANLEYGTERYRKAIAPLLQDQAAYAAHDAALKATKAKEYSKARGLAAKAIKLQPREAKFYGLQGDIALLEKQYQTAVKNYDKAIKLYPDYFAFHLQQGYAKKELGDVAGATQALEKSNQLLPTPNAQKALGDLALSKGNKAQALQYYDAASSSRSDSGQAALASMASLELEDNPQKYLKTKLGLDRQGRVVIAVYNQSPLAVKDVQVIAAHFDAQGQQKSKRATFNVRGEIAAKGQATVATGITDGRGLRAAVSSARISR